MQLADVGLSRYATDTEIFQSMQQRRLVLVTKDTDFITQLRYAHGHDGILFVRQSKTEVQDLVTAVLTLVAQFPTIANLRFEILPRSFVQRIPLVLQQHLPITLALASVNSSLVSIGW